MGLTFRGTSGTLRWGYQPAADVGTWTITRDDSGTRLAATLTSSNAFRLSQRPLVFEAPRIGRFPVDELQITGAACSARLGPKE